MHNDTTINDLHTTRCYPPLTSLEHFVEIRQICQLPDGPGIDELARWSAVFAERREEHVLDCSLGMLPFRSQSLTQGDVLSDCSDIRSGE